MASVEAARAKKGEDEEKEAQISAEKAKGGGQFESQKALLSELFKASFTGNLSQLQRTLISISSAALSEETKEEEETKDSCSLSITTETRPSSTAAGNVSSSASLQESSSAILSFLSSSQIHELSIHLKEYRDGNRKTALHFACAGGQEKPVEILLCLDPSLVREKDVEGETPLFFLLRGEYEKTSGARLSILKLLLEYKANVNERNSHGLTPLHLAAGERGGKAFAQLLVQAGAHVDAVSNHFGTPLQRAVIAGCRDTARYLLSVGANPDGGEAVRFQSTKITSSSSPSSPSPDKKIAREKEEQNRNQAETPAWSSSSPKPGDTEKRESSTDEGRSAKDEKEAGVEDEAQKEEDDRSQERKEGREKATEEKDVVVQLPPPPLVYASSIEDEDTVLELIYAGADVDIKDADGWTALQCASEVGADGIVVALLEAGAKPNVITHGVTAFDLAVQNERLTTASILKDLTGGMTAAELRDGKDQGAEGDMAATAGTLHRTQKKKGAQARQSSTLLHAPRGRGRQEGLGEDDFTRAYASEPNRQELTPEEEQSVSEANRLKDEGNQFFAKKSFQKALDTYMKALEICPRVSATRRQRAALHCNSCLMLLELGQAPAKALEHAQRAVALDPEWQRGYYRAGQALKALNDPAEAAQQFWQALLRDPDNDDISHEFRAAVAAAREKHGQTQAAAERKSAAAGDGF